MERVKSEVVCKCGISLSAVEKSVTSNMATKMIGQNNFEYKGNSNGIVLLVKELSHCSFCS